MPPVIYTICFGIVRALLAAWCGGCVHRGYATQGDLNAAIEWAVPVLLIAAWSALTHYKDALRLLVLQKLAKPPVSHDDVTDYVLTAPAAVLASVLTKPTAIPVPKQAA